jgi:hypothetical protein
MSAHAGIMNGNPQVGGADRLTDLLTRRCGTGETVRDVGDSYRPDFLVSETGQNTGDGGDVRRSAHNPEVEGSNPSPATKFAGQRPLPIMEGAFCVCRVHRIVHEASEEGRGRLGGEAYPADVVRAAGGGRTSTEARRPNVCDRLQIKCNPPTIDP